MHATFCYVLLICAFVRPGSAFQQRVLEDSRYEIAYPDIYRTRRTNAYLASDLIGLRAQAVTSAATHEANQFPSLEDTTQFFASARDLFSHAAIHKTDQRSCTPGRRVLTVVLGHGNPSRSARLVESLNFLDEQNACFQCIVFTWSNDLHLDGMPKRCELIRHSGAFLDYGKMIPAERLDEVDYVFMLRDDVSLNATGKPVDLSSLVDIAHDHCLDVATPSMSAGDDGVLVHPLLAPRYGDDADASASGRILDYIEWHGLLLTRTALGVVNDMVRPDLSACWGYEDIFHSFFSRRMSRQPRFGVVASMQMEIHSDIPSVTFVSAALALHQEYHVHVGQRGHRRQSPESLDGLVSPETSPCGMCTFKGRRECDAAHSVKQFWKQYGVFPSRQVELCRLTSDCGYAPKSESVCPAIQ